MEVQRGVCSLCSENSRTLSPSNSEEFLNFLPWILHDGFLSESEFQKIKKSLKVCCLCCYKIEKAKEAKEAIRYEENHKVSDISEKQCHFCKDNKWIVKINDDWKQFVSKTEDFLTAADFPVFICTRCMFYFDTIFNIKTRLTYKFPHLSLSLKNQKQTDTPKRKSMSTSPPSSKKRKIFDNCFTYLQPLCNNNSYSVNKAVKADAKMYRKIVYVNLKDAKDIYSKETPKVRPKIKIKLKKPKKQEKDKEKEKANQKKVFDMLQEDGFVSQPYVKLHKSEEIPNKLRSEKSKERRLSLFNEGREGTEEKLDDTPKAATADNPIPKRRVSLFAESKEPDIGEPDTGEQDVEKSDAENQINSEEINNIVDEYIKDSTFDDENKLDLLQEIEEISTEKKTDEDEQSKIEENGVEKAGGEISEEESEKQKSESDKESDSELLQNDNHNNVSDKESSPSPVLETITPSKNDNSGEGSDSGDKGNLDRDSLNGSERKKKRVTFSDEITE